MPIQGYGRIKGQRFYRAAAAALLTLSVLLLACTRVDTQTPTPVPEEPTATATPTPSPSPVPPTATPTPGIPTPTPTLMPLPTPEPPWEAIEELRPSIVKVTTEHGSGTGVIVRSPFIGHATIMTNRLIVDGAEAISVITNDGTEYDAKAIEEDEARNLAYIDICCSTSLEALTLDRDAAAFPDSWVFMTGVPADEQELLASLAKIVDVRFEPDADLEIIETDAAVDPGLSGGLLLNEDGTIAGILTNDIESSANGVSAEGRGHAISALTAQRGIETAEFNNHYELEPIYGTAPASVSGKPLDPDAVYGGVLQVAYTAHGRTYSTWEESLAFAFQTMHPLHNMLIQPRTWGDTEDYEDGAFFELHPDIAEAWRVSADGLQYIFDIREGIEWTDGTPLTCTDVKWSFDTIRTGEGLRRSPRAKYFSAIDGIICVDTLTVVFSLHQPVPALAEAIALPFNIIRPAHVYGEGRDAWTGLTSLRNERPIITSGPFRLIAGEDEQPYIFERNNRYWDEPLPYLDGIEAHFMASSLVPAAMRTGRLHIGRPWGFNGSSGDALLQECDDNVCQHWEPVIASAFSPALFLNRTRPPWSEPAVNEAFALAIDNQRYVDTTRHGWSVLPTGCGFYPASSWAMPAERCAAIPGYGDVIGTSTAEEDKRRAREILNQAGYGPGSLNLTLSVWQPLEKEAEAFIRDLEDIGVDVVANILGSAQAYNDWSIGDFDVGVHSFWNSGLDPDMLFYEQFYTDSDRNYNRYSNFEFDELVDRMSITLDPEERRELAWEAMEIALTDVAKIITAHEVFVPVTNVNVRGFMPAVQYLAFYGPQNRYDHVWLAE